MADPPPKAPEDRRDDALWKTKGPRSDTCRSWGLLIQVRSCRLLVIKQRAFTVDEVREPAETRVLIRLWDDQGFQ